MTQWSNKGTLTGAIQDSMQVMLLDKTRPNTKDQNILATLAMLRDFITGGMPIPPPDTEWVVMPTVTTDPENPFKYDINGAGVANFPDTEGQTYAATSHTVEPAGANLKYVFLLYAKPDGTYGTVSGPQSQNPPTPPYPADSLYVAHAIISESGSEVQEPIAFVTLEQVRELLGDELRDYLPLSLSENLLLQLNGFFLDAVDDNGQSSSSYAMWNAQPYLNYTTKQGGRTFSFNFGRVAGDPYYEQYELAADGVTQIGTPYGIRWNSQLGGVEIYGDQFYVNGVAFTRGGDLPANVLTSDDISTDVEDAGQDVKLITQGQVQALLQDYPQFSTDTFEIGPTEGKILVLGDVLHVFGESANEEPLLQYKKTTEITTDAQAMASNGLYSKYQGSYWKRQPSVQEIAESATAAQFSNQVFDI